MGSNSVALRGKPRRLREIFQSYDVPLYFVTFCTMDRVPCLASQEIHEAFLAYADRALAHGVAVGKYVIMPDHVHLFVRMGGACSLGEWVKGLKRCMEAAYSGPAKRIWQPGFFDHLLRHDESYAQKWAYVVQNPIRKGLATSVDGWPFQGSVCSIDRV